MNFLTPEEARKLLEAAVDDRLHALWVLALTTGMRLGELLALKWEDVAFRAGTISIRRSVQWVGKPTLSEPKNKSSYRTIPLPGLAVEAQKGHRKRQLQEKLLLGQDYKDQGLVFATPFGGIIDKDNLSKRFFLRLLEKAGIGKKIRFHDLRHTAASLLLAEGVPIKTVQSVLGHSTASMTLDRYGHAIPGAGKEAARKMDDLFSSRPRMA